MGTGPGGTWSKSPHFVMCPCLTLTPLCPPVLHCPTVWSGQRGSNLCPGWAPHASEVPRRWVCSWGGEDSSPWITTRGINRPLPGQAVCPLWHGGDWQRQGRSPRDLADPCREGPLLDKVLWKTPRVLANWCPGHPQGRAPWQHPIPLCPTWATHSQPAPGGAEGGGRHP